MTDHKQLTLTLSRWHLVADRLNAKIKELEGLALNTFNATNISALQGESHKNRLVQQRDGALAHVALIRGMLQTVGQIRAAVADANAKAGVTQELARLEVLNREVRLLNTLAQINNDSKIEIDYLLTHFDNLAKTGVADSGRFGRAHSGVEVVMLSSADQDVFRSEKETLQAQAHALSDSINTRNKETLTISLDLQSARFAGLL